MLRTCTVAIIGLVGLPAMAQYGRVEDGRAGDANLRVGSGGRNLPRNGYLPRLGNEIVTGNVTRGLHFRAASPITSTTEFGFGTPLGTTELDGFRRDSVGVSDIRSGYRSYRPRPYYSRTSTVTSTGGLSVGFRDSGARDLPRSYINLPGDPLDTQLIKSNPFSRQIRILPQSDRPHPTFSDQLPRLDTIYSRSLTRSGLFGVAPDPATAAAELDAGLDVGRRERESGVSSRLRSQLGIPVGPGGLTPPVGSERPDYAIPGGSALDRLLNPPSYQGPFAAEPPASADPTSGRADAGPQGPASVTRDYGAPGTGLGSEQDRIEQASRASRTVFEGDVYRTMVRAASMIRDIAPPDQAQRGIAGAFARPEADQAVPTKPGEQRPARAANLPKQHEDEVRAMLAKPVATFTGTTRTIANKAFKEAEARLAAGRYYDAVTAYDVARAADPGNALVWIGRGHALIGAGDYLSASVSLEEGLARFPQFARFRIDLKAFLSHGDILDIRRADLERRLAQKENYRLRFLLGYIEYFSGFEKFGLPNLKRAAKDAPTTSVITKVPKMLGK